MKSTPPILLFGLLFRCLVTEAATLSIATDRSANGRYTADISSTAPNEIIVAIQRQAGDVKVLDWSKKVPWNGANATITAFPWIRRYIRNDGSAVILHNQQYNQDYWVWISTNGQPIRHYLSDINRALGVTANPRPFHPLMNHPEALQFILEEKEVHAIWFPSSDKWIAIDLKTGALKVPDGDVIAAVTSLPLGPTDAEVWLKPPSEALISVLEEEAKRRSLEAVRRHQPGTIKSLLKPIRQKLGQMIPSLKAATAPGRNQFAESYGAYLFLARRRVSEGETYIQQLLKHPFEQAISMMSYHDVPEYNVFSQDRMLGDAAWFLWNRTNPAPSEASNAFVHRSRGIWGALGVGYKVQTHYLGTVRGRLTLPMVRPDTKPGAVWVYLIPAGVKPGDWGKSADIMRLYCSLE